MLQIDITVSLELRIEKRATLTDLRLCFVEIATVLCILRVLEEGCLSRWHRRAGRTYMEQEMSLSKDMERASCKCIVPWCSREKNQSGNGLCRRHYDQVRKHGRVLETRTIKDPSRVVVDGNNAEIIITDRLDTVICRAIIDAEDADLVKPFRWTMNGNGYVRTFINGTSPTYLHRFVLGYSGKNEVDHIDRNKLNNKKVNLRVVDRSMNRCNRNNNPCDLNNSRTYKIKKPYLASFNFRGERYFLGYYETREEAAMAIRKKKIELGIVVF